MSKNLWLVIIIVLFGQKQAHSQVNDLQNLNFFIGEWSLETLDIQPDGTFKKGRAKSVVKYILNKRAIQDDFLMLNENEQVIFIGLSIRSFNQITGKYHSKQKVRWI